jgi:hypothetical protein
MGDQTIAAEANELDPRSKVVLQASDLRFDVLHEGAMGTQHHEQDWLRPKVGCSERVSVKRVSVHPGQTKRW